MASEWSYWIYISLIHLSTFCMLIILIIHGIKIYFDVFDEDRKSLSHMADRNKPLPKLNKRYKFITITIWIDLLLFTLTGSFIAASLYIPAHSSNCGLILQIINNCFQLSKMMMYLIFVFRLYTVYSINYEVTTTFGYNIYLLLSIAVIIILWHVSVMILISIDTPRNIQHSYCYINHNDLRKWIMAMVMIMDTIFFVLFIALFLRPLRNLISNFEMNDESARIEQFNQIMRRLLPTKYLIVISGAAYITLLSHLWDIIISNDHFNCIFPIILCVNCICIALMSLYYSDFVYFQNLCCLCIMCCSCIISVRKKSKMKEKEKEYQAVNTKDEQILQRQTSRTGTSKHHESVFETRGETVKKEHSMIEQSEMTKTKLGVNDHSAMNEQSVTQIGKMSTLTRYIS